MNELTNFATAEGTYNSIPTSLTSNTSVVNLIDGLTLSLSADKQNWINGVLTYTITLSNQTTTSYQNPVISDTLDTTLVTFVEDSVTINETKASSSEYSYDTSNNTLKITLTEVQPNSNTIIKFQVKKKTI